MGGGGACFWAAAFAGRCERMFWCASGSREKDASPFPTTCVHALSSRRKCLQSRFAKVDSRTNPSSYPVY